MSFSFESLVKVKKGRSSPLRESAAKRKESDTSGVKSRYWFYGMGDGVPPTSHVAPKVPVTKEAADAPAEDDSLTPDDQALQIITKNPGISAATLLNTLKGLGFKIVDTRGDVKPPPEGTDSEDDNEETRKEADSATAFSQVTRGDQPNKKESDAGTAGQLRFRESVRFTVIESARDDGIGPTKFKVVLLQEGLGNFKDRYYYTREALQSAIPIFEGKKMYADHPDAFEEKTRPERSVRDIIGHYENCKVEESSDGRAQLVAEANLIPSEPYRWARSLITEAAKYNEKFPDKDFVGLSINAGGDSEEVQLSKFMSETDIPKSIMPKLEKAIAQGARTIRPVRAFKDAKSCDLVTEPGAGGKVLEMLEKEKAMSKETKNKNRESDPSKDGGGADGKGGGDADQAKDGELIKAMLKKHAGVDNPDEEAMKMAKDMYEACVGGGMKKEEAAESVGHSMKVAKILGDKKAKEAEEAGKAGDANVASEATDGDADDKKKESDQKDAEGKQQMKETIISLQAKVARLEESNKKVELVEYLDGVLEKSKLPFSATDKLRESIGDLKSKEQIDRDLKIFTEAYNANGVAGKRTITTEKIRESNRGSSKIDLSDCKK